MIYILCIIIIIIILCIYISLFLFFSVASSESTSNATPCRRSSRLKTLSESKSDIVSEEEKNSTPIDNNTKSSDETKPTKRKTRSSSASATQNPILNETKEEAVNLPDDIRHDVGSQEDSVTERESPAPCDKEIDISSDSDSEKPLT